MEVVGFQSAGGVGAEAPVGSAEASRLAIPFKDSLLVSIAAGLGYCFDAYAVNIYGIVLPLIALDFHVGPAALGIVGSILLIGYTLGTIGFGWAADKWGRRDTLGVSILTYGVTTALGGLAPTVPIFAILRFITGVGGAGELAVGAPYTAEMWPAKHRAIGVGGVIFSLYSIGYIIAGLSALLIVPLVGWRWAFGAAIVPAVAVFLIRRMVKESIRFLEVKAERAKQASKGESIFANPIARKRLYVGWVIYIANAVGYWGETVFLVLYITKKFHASVTTAITYVILFFVVQFFLSYVGAWLADTIGRRPTGVIGACVLIVTTLIAYSTSSLAVFLVFGAITIGMLGYIWALSDTYISEMFPTRMRGTGFGLCVGGGRVFSIFAPAAIGFLIANVGLSLGFQLISGLWILTIIGYLMGPETKGKELEELAF
ncbi:MAG: MFS transporter [Chloroflexota bacterium]